MGLLSAEQRVRNLSTCTFISYGTPVRRTKRQKYQQMHFQEFWDSCAQNKTSEIPRAELSGILGLLCAEQNVGNLKKCTFRNSGTPVRRTDRRKSQQKSFQDLWDSCAQNKTSEVSKHGLSRILGLLCADQDVDNLEKMDFQELWDSCAQNKT